MAAALVLSETEGEIVHPNITQNILVGSTPTEKYVHAYARIQQIRLGEESYKVTAYKAAPENTCNSVIGAVDVYITGAQPQSMIVYQNI